MVTVTEPMEGCADLEYVCEIEKLAIDDVQIAPEPSTFLLMGTGAAILGFFRLRKRA